MKGPNGVLPRWRIDCGLSTNRRVDHCEQGRRDLHDANAAHVRRGDESGEISNDAATQRDDGRVATATECEQRVRDRGPLLARLVLLATRDDDRVNALARLSGAKLARERVADRREIAWRDVLVADDGVVVRRGALANELCYATERA